MSQSNYSEYKDNLAYMIDCLYTKLIIHPEEPDQGYTIRSNLHRDFKSAFAQITQRIILKAQLTQRSIFKTQITEELIAAAMHPKRMQKQMNQFEDIEQYFEQMGY